MPLLPLPACAVLVDPLRPPLDDTPNPRANLFYIFTCRDDYPQVGVARGDFLYCWAMDPAAITPDHPWLDQVRDGSLVFGRLPGATEAGLYYLWRTDDGRIRLTSHPDLYRDGSPLTPMAPVVCALDDFAIQCRVASVVRVQAPIAFADLVGGAHD